MWFATSSAAAKAPAASKKAASKKPTTPTVQVAPKTTAQRKTAKQESPDRNFPRGVVVDVTQAPYSAIPNDGKDDTAAIQRAISEADLRVLYFPRGTYLLSDTLVAKNTKGDWKDNLHIQGQNRNGTVFKLQDNAPGFGDAAKPKPLIISASQVDEKDVNHPFFATGAGNKAFRNNLMDFTLDTGKGNDGAVGIDYVANNASSIKNVTIRSGDGRGQVGILFGRDHPGPFLLKNIFITGFDYGLSAEKMMTITCENLRVQGQNVAGLRVAAGGMFSLRQLASNNKVPAVLVDGDALFSLLNGNLSGGSPGNPAIATTEKAQYLLLRNVVSSGYKAGSLQWRGQEVAIPKGGEWVSTKAQSSFPATLSTLNMAVKETPDYWNNNLRDWAVVEPSTGGDDTALIQRAIDSGKSVVVFPTGTKYWVKGTIHVRGKVRQILGMNVTLYSLWPKEGEKAVSPFIRFENTGATLFMERVFIQTHHDVRVFENVSPHALIMKQVQSWGTGEAYWNKPGAGPLFMEDVSNDAHNYNYWRFNKQELWARQFNPELNWEGKPDIAPWITNDGGSMWIFGMKTEGMGPVTATLNGGRTELFGNFHLQPFDKVFVPADMPLHIVNDSTASLSFTNAYWAPEKNDHRIYVEDTHNGETRNLFREQSLGSPNVRVVPLYRSQPNRPKPIEMPGNIPIAKAP
jgi:hypothetical protein